MHQIGRVIQHKLERPHEYSGAFGRVEVTIEFDVYGGGMTFFIELGKLDEFPIGSRVRVPIEPQVLEPKGGR